MNDALLSLPSYTLFDVVYTPFDAFLAVAFTIRQGFVSVFIATRAHANRFYEELYGHKKVYAFNYAQ